MAHYDLFISYSHIDNQPLKEGQAPWVTTFQRAVQVRLSQLLGRRAEVWWDKRRLTGYDRFDDVIEAACRNCRVMVAIVTPSYLASDYCRKEREFFVSTLVEGHDSIPLVRVEKTPVPRGKLPSEFQGRLGYQFYCPGETETTFREFAVHDDQDTEFLNQVERMAQEVRALLRGASLSPSQLSVLAATSASGTHSVKAAGRVFLAFTASDVRPIRNSVARELSARGILHAPETEPSIVGQELRAALTGAAAQADVAVHIVGRSHGFIPEGEATSIPEVQYDMVAAELKARGPDAPLARIVWFAAPSSDNPAQEAFLDRLRRERYGRYDELLLGTEEELKSRILARLAEIERVKAEQQAAPSKSTTGAGALVRQVYVISADGDDAVKEVEDVLFDGGLEVISSVEIAEVSEAEKEAVHQGYLESCDACLVYHGKSHVAWVRAQVDDVRKATGLRVEPMSDQAVYVAPPIVGAKRRYRLQLFRRIDGNGVIRAELESFIHRVLQRGAA